MRLYLYRYLELFGYIGEATPEDPGSDFGMAVWIEAPDEQAALDWGRVLLADYVRARHRYDDSGTNIETGRIEGWLENDQAALERAVESYPRCRVGEFPVWQSPWRHDNSRTRAVPPAVEDNP